MVFGLLAVVFGLSVASAQSAREKVVVGPHPSGNVSVAARTTPRAIEPAANAAQPVSQTPQAFPPVQYKTSGKEFYFVFLSSVSSDPTNTPLRRVYISSRAHVRVKISHVGGTWSQTFHVLPKSLTPVTLPTWASLDRLEIEAAYRRVFKIEAEDDVAVYALSPNYLSSDGFMVLPKESLGREYVVASVRNALWYASGALKPPMGGEPYPRSEFGVAAIEDNTEVTIRLTADSYSRRYEKGYYYKFTLDRGEVIQFMARDTGRKELVNYFDNLTKTFIPKMSWVGKEADGTDCDLTGSEVLATKPVAVFSGHERAAVPDELEFAWEDHPDVSRDHLIEQMPPVEVWGKRFIVIASLQDYQQSRPPGGDVVRVIARYDGTEYIVNGVSRGTLNQGQYAQFLSGDFSHIETSQPALVVKYLATAQLNALGESGAGDPDMTVVPPVENMSTFFSLPTIHLGSYFTEHFITLIVDTGAMHTTLLNGKLPDNTMYKALPNLPYMFARFRTEFEGEQRVESTLPCYAETYGYGDVDSYSFSGGGDYHYIRGLAAQDLNFGFVKLGDARDSVTTVLSTIAPSPLADTITVFRYTWESGDTTVFGMLDTINTPIKLAPGQTLPVSFSFKPTKTGSFTARLRVWSNNLSPVYINVIGAAGTSWLLVDPNHIDFGRVRVGSANAAKFQYAHQGDQNVPITLYNPNFKNDIKNVGVFGTTDHTDIGVSSTFILGFDHNVTFSPKARTFYTDTLFLPNSGIDNDTDFVVLRGRGIQPVVTSDSLNFGSIRFGLSSGWKPIQIRNIGDDFTRIISIELDSGDIADFALDPATLPLPVTPIALDTLNSGKEQVVYNASFAPIPKSLPDLFGWRTVKVRIITDEDTLYRYLRGRGVEPWFEAAPLTIDFGTIKNPRLVDPGQYKKKFAVRNIGTMDGLLSELKIPDHSPDDSVYFAVEQKTSTFATNAEDSIEVTFFIKNVGVFFDSVVVMNDSRKTPLVYFRGSVEAEYELNDSIYLDTVTNCVPIDTIVRIVNPYRIPITITDTLFSGNPGGFTFYPDVIVTDPPIVIAPGQYFDFTVRYEFPIDSVNGDQIFHLIITKPVVLGGIQSMDEDTVHITLVRRMQILDLITAKLPYNPNAKDAPFRLPVHIKGNRLGKPELDNMTVRLKFSNRLVSPVGIDRTGSLTESTSTNGIPDQPQWTWDETTGIMTIPIKDTKISSDPSKNTLLFTLLGTTYLATDTVVEISPEIVYEAPPCAYRISRDSVTVIYANECGDRTIRDLMLRNPGFTIGNPYPDPSTPAQGAVSIPYVAAQDYVVQWNIYDERGTVCHTSNEQRIAKGIGALVVEKRTLPASGVYLFEVTVRDDQNNLVDKRATKFIVAD